MPDSVGDSFSISSSCWAEDSFHAKCFCSTCSVNEGASDSLSFPETNLYTFFILFHLLNLFVGPHQSPKMPFYGSSIGFALSPPSLRTVGSRTHGEQNDEDGKKPGGVCGVYGIADGV